MCIFNRCKVFTVFLVHYFSDAKPTSCLFYKLTLKFDIYFIYDVFFSLQPCFIFSYVGICC